MWIRRVEVRNCAGIAAAGIDLEPGMNILHGPNELGKSSLVRAIRAALLLQASSSAAEALFDWHVDAPPDVSVTVEQEPGRIYRVRKVFGGQGSQSYLDFSRDGETFEPELKGRGVDGALQGILRWGVDAPGGRGRRKRGMPTSFISTALLGEQADVVAVLETSLADDPDGAGREHLTEALQALAEDPRLKRVIAATQDEVDKAFTAKGRKRGGQGSFWTQLRDELRVAEEHRRTVEGQMAESEGARGRIEELNEGLLKAQADERTVRERVAQLEQEAGVWEKRRVLEDALQKVSLEVDQMRATRTRRDDAKRSLSEIAKDLDALTTRRQEQADALRETENARDQARDRVRELESGADEQARRLRQETAKTNRLGLERDLDAIAQQQEKARRLHALDAEIADLTESHAALQESLAEKRGLLAQAQQRTEQDEEELEDLEFDLQIARLLTAREHASASEQALAVATEAAERAMALEAEAEQLREEAVSRGSPSDDELEALETAWSALTLAREKLSVGLSMDIDFERDVDHTVRADDADVPMSGRTTRVDAEREIELVLAEIGTIRIRAGTRDLAQALEAATAAWDSISAPILTRSATTHMDQLIALHGEVQSQLAQADERDREASEARVRAENLDELARHASVAAADVARVTAAAEAFLEETVDDYLAAIDERPDDEIAIEEAIQGLRSAMTKRGTLCNQMEAAVAGEESGFRSLDESLETKRATLTAESAALGDSWREDLEKADAQREEIEQAIELVDTELEAIESEATDEVEVAATEATEQETAASEARAKLDETDASIETARAEHARLEGELAELDRAVAADDLDAIEARLTEAETELEAVALVDQPDPDELHNARETHDATERRVRSLEGELRSAEGALQQVGGQYAEEQVQQAAESVTAIREREHDYEVEFGAWKLLREVLAEAEREDSVHLGNALVQPVSHRMRELTTGRYGDIAIGPQLDSNGIEFAGGERSFEHLSVGTQEQIALLLRLSIAEALGAFVVLDDHLTQTDPGRIAAMLGFLEQAAQQIQVVVLTCHPEAYRDAGEAANVVDLAPRVTRTAGGDSALPSDAAADESGLNTDSREEMQTEPEGGDATPDEPMASKPTRRRRRRDRREDAGDADLSAALRASLERDGDEG